MIQLEYGCDYITATAPLKSEACATLDAAYDAVKFDEMSNGFDEKPARALGTVGNQIGTLYLGSTSEYRMLRCSGSWADDVLQLIAQPLAMPKVTRVDFQVTVGRIYDISGTAETTCAQVRLHQATSGQASQPHPTLIQGFGKGDTFNLGSRSSEVFIRVYDKSREAGEIGPPWRWRYEVELKGRRAQQAVEFYCMSGHTDEHARAVVESHLAARGVQFPWEHVTDLEFETLERPTTDDEKQLNWLRNQVRKTVRTLSSKGFRDEVIAALGLDSPITS